MGLVDAITDEAVARAGPEPWREKVNRARVKLDLLAHPALMLDKITRQEAIHRQGLQSLQNAATRALGEDPAETEAPEMGVNIGDQIHYHIDDRDSSSSGDPAAGKLARLGMAAAVGAGLLGGVGGPLAGWLISRAAPRAAPSAPAAVAPADPNFHDTNSVTEPRASVRD